MKISVIIPTVRMGGLDVLMHGLSRQTFDPYDYEIILVDSCYEERLDGCKLLPWVVGSSIFKHIPLPDKYDYYDASYANNVGLREARGELIVFMTDNVWPEPKLLERHWDAYCNHRGYSMTGFCDRYELPPLRPNPTWENSWWSVYSEPFTHDFAHDYFSRLEPYYRERKGGVHGDAVPASDYFELPGRLFYAGLNESIPMFVLKEINGWNQDLDGGYGCADIELGMRANAAGWKFLINPESVNFKLGERANSIGIPGKFKPNIRTPDQQLAMVNNLIAEINAGRAPVKIKNGAW